MPDFPTTLDGSGPNTKIEYLYRDVANYKKSATVVLSGQITSEQVEKMSLSLADGEFFVPAQVGLENLATDGFDPELDHVSHTFGSIEHTADAADSISVAEMVDDWPASSEDWVYEEPDSSPAPGR